MAGIIWQDLPRPAMPRIRAQLAVQLPPELLERLRATAAAQRRTVTALLTDWIEAGLAGALEPGAAAPTGGSDLAARVAALEAAMAAMQRPPLSSPKRVSSPPPEQVSLLPHMGEPPIPQTGELPASAITTAELAERTNTNRAAWNNWAAKAAAGDVRSHPGAGSWRLVGKAPAPSGGPARWLWEPA